MAKGVKVNFSLKKLANGAAKEMATLFNNVATDMQLDAEKALSQGQDQTGRPFKQLALSTVASKTEKGFSDPAAPLLATKTMLNSFRISKRATAGSLKAILTINPRRSFIASKHQTGDGVPKRVFFPTKINKRVRPQVEKNIRASERRLVKLVRGR